MTTCLYIKTRSVKVGQSATLSIGLNSAGAQISALQFDIVLGGLSYINANPGPVATAARKDVTSSVISANTLRTLIYGINQNVMGDGVVAIIKLNTPQAGLFRLVPTNVVCSDPAGNSDASKSFGMDLSVIAPTTSNKKTDLDTSINNLDAAVNLLVDAAVSLVARRL